MLNPANDPTAFPPWLKTPLAHLLTLARDGQIPSGLLVSGPQGMGKGLLVRTFLQRIACTRRDDELFPCGVCNGCRSYLSGAHPETLLVVPEEPGKEILVDAVREIIDFLSLSRAGPVRLVFIEPAEAMNVNAANALLRTLEEPPAGAAIVLATARAGHLPATVRSRCRILRVHAPGSETAQSWLRSVAGDGNLPVDAAFAAALNRPFDALALLGDSDAAAVWARDREALAAFLSGGSPMEAAALLRRCEMTTFIPRLQCLLHSAQTYLASGEIDAFGGMFDPGVLESFARRQGASGLARLAGESMRWNREISTPLNPELRRDALAMRVMKAQA